MSLLAVMGAGAMVLAIDPEGAPIEARLCIRMGFTCLRDIARAVRIPYDPDPQPDDPLVLTRAQFDDARDRLVAAGFATSRPVDEAWVHFQGWRVNYEAVAFAVAYRFNAPPAMWSGPRQMFPAESLLPERPADRRPTGVPGGPGGIRREPGRKPDGPQL